MKRHWITCAALCVASLLSLNVAAQGFPSKPVRIVVPWSPGGGVDTLARLLQPKLSEGLGRPVIVENKAGATGAIGTDFVAKSPPDGYHLIIGSPGVMSIAGVLNPRLPYKPLTDFEPVSMGTLISNVLIVNPALPVNSVAELIALARSQPGKITYASSGIGSSLHLAGELLKMLGKFDMLHVPYKGTSPAVAGIIGGETHLMFADPSALPLVKAGKLRALAQSTLKRSTAMPELPTVAEAGVAGYDIANWYAFFAAAGTPGPIVARLNAELVKALNDPEIKARLIAAGQDPTPSTPQELGAYLKADHALWTRVAAEAKIKLE